MSLSCEARVASNLLYIKCIPKLHILCETTVKKYNTYNRDENCRREFDQ